MFLEQQSVYDNWFLKNHVDTEDKFSFDRRNQLFDYLFT